MKIGLILFVLFSHQVWALYGAKIRPSNAPFMATLETGGLRCQGVLISPKKILTAGHCIDVMGWMVYEYSHALIYRPDLLSIKFGSREYLAESITLTPSYFEGTGLDTEDLALIELAEPVKGIRPIRLADQGEVRLGAVQLMANGKQVETSLISTRTYPETTVLWLDKSAGACRGDSGGAVVINKNGELLLAGILSYRGEGECGEKMGVAHFPKAQF